MKLRLIGVLGIAGVLVTAGCSGTSTKGPAPQTSGSGPSLTANQSPEPATSAPTVNSGVTPHSSPAPAAASVGPVGGAVPAGFHPASVTFVDATHGWVIGTASCATKPCTSVLRTTDGGATWKGIPAPKADLTFDQQIDGSPVQSIRFANQLDGWAFGQQLWSTHDGGGSWHRVTFGGATTGIESLETGGGRAYATTIDCRVGSGGSCSRTTQVIEASISSDSWHAISTLSTAVGTEGYTQAILTAHGNQWWLPLATGLYHGVGISPPTKLVNPCVAFQQPLPGGFEFATNDNVHLDALCPSGNGAMGSTAIQLRGSVDAGEHWANSGRVTTTPTNQSGIADNGAGVLLVAAYSGGSEVSRTTDDGGSYTTVLPVNNGGNAWADLGFTTSTQAVVVMPGTGLWTSSNAGQTWKRMTF